MGTSNEERQISRDLTAGITIRELKKMMSDAELNIKQPIKQGHLCIIRQREHGGLKELYSVTITLPNGRTAAKSWEVKNTQRHPGKIWKWLEPKIQLWRDVKD